MPTRAANASLRSTSAKHATAATNATSPSSAATVRPASASPWMASSANARIGMPSLMRLFQIPLTTTDSVVRDREKPHDDIIA